MKKISLLEKIIMKFGYERTDYVDQIRDALVLSSEQNIELVAKVNKLEEENISLSCALTAVNKMLNEAEKKAAAAEMAKQKQLASMKMAKKFEESKKAILGGK